MLNNNSLRDISSVRLEEANVSKYTSKENFKVQPTKEKVKSLKELGLNRKEMRMLLKGKNVNWQDPNSTIREYEFSIYKIENGVFKASVLSIQNKKASGVLRNFVLKTEKAAKGLGCNYLEINGLSVEPKLSKVMEKRYGFSLGNDLFVETTNRYEPSLSRTFDLSKKIELEVVSKNSSRGPKYK